MKILMLTPYLPYPPVSGGQTRSYHLLLHLSKRHEITLCCYYRHEDEKKYTKHLKRYVKEIFLIKRRPVFHPMHFFQAIFTSKPFLLVSTYYAPELQKKISQFLNEKKYDLIHAETFYVTPNIPQTKIPIIVVEQTIEYHVYDHYVRNKPKWVHALLQPELKKLLLWEQKAWQRASRIITVSEEDKATVATIDPRQKNKIAVVPNGTDIEEFKALSKREHSLTNPTFVYVGNFKWLQNTEAVQYLLTEIWPQISKIFPHSRLIIAGRNIPKRIIASHKGIHFYESVPDIREVYRQADVLIAPLFGPGGTRLKILEAMAARVAVVTTSVGAMGLSLSDGKDVVLFSTAHEAVEKITRLIHEPGQMKKITDAAYEKVHDMYDWRSIVQKLEANYQIVLEEHENRH